MPRRVLYAEVPSFYAAVERADDPALVDRPVIVGGDPRKGGRVQSATRDALAAGVTLEMPVLEALRRCPQARALRTNMPHYREISRRLIALLRGVAPRLEPFGLGAAFFEVRPEDADSPRFAEALRGAVRDGLGLPTRVGVASAKYLARLAAEEVEEDGVRRIAPGEEHVFLAPLPVTRLDGVGRKTAAKLAELGADTVGDLRELGRDRLQDVFGTHGLRIHAFATASDDEPVRAARHPQSVSREATVRGESDVGALVEQLAGLCQELERELARQGLAAGRVTLKLRFADQGTTSRTVSVRDPVGAAPRLLGLSQELLDRTQAGARPVRGLGVQLAALVPAAESDRQLDLFAG